MPVICYSVQRTFARGVEYRSPRWFVTPLARPGDRVVVCGHWPNVVSAYERAGVPVSAQAGPYFGESAEPESVPASPTESILDPAMLQKVTHRDVAAEVSAQSVENPLFSMTRAELQAEAKSRGIDLKPGLSRGEILRAMGAV